MIVALRMRRVTGTEAVGVLLQGTSNKLAVPMGTSHEAFLAFETKHHNFKFNVDTYNTWASLRVRLLRCVHGYCVLFHVSLCAPSAS